jgi:hypothetical protein
VSLRRAPRRSACCRARSGWWRSQPHAGGTCRRRGRRTGDQTKGVTVKFAGKEVPGVRKATAVASKPVRKAARKATPNRLRVQARGIADDLNPNITPPLATREASKAAIMATRTARAKASHGQHVAQEEGVGLAKRISQEDEQKVLDAIEAGDYSGLSPDFRSSRSSASATSSSTSTGYAGARGSRAAPDANYVPHYLTEDTLFRSARSPASRISAGASSGPRQASSASARARSLISGDASRPVPRGPARRLRAAHVGGHTAEARGELNRVARGQLGPHVEEGQADRAQAGRGGLQAARFGPSGSHGAEGREGAPPA